VPRKFFTQHHSTTRHAHTTPPNAELRPSFLGNPDLELRKISAQSPTVPRLRLVGEPINRGSASSPPRGVYTLVVLYGVTLFAPEVDSQGLLLCAGGVLVCVSKPPRSGGAVAQADARELWVVGFSFSPTV
jgi:hypothetical protein